MVTHRFTAHLHHVGLKYAVLVPSAVASGLGGARFIRVDGTADGVSFTARLVPAGNNTLLLYLDSRLRAEAGIDIGADVDVELWAKDPGADIELPSDIVAVISGVPSGWEAWEALSLDAKRTRLAHVRGAKRPSVRERRLLEFAEDLRRKAGAGNDKP